jgi:hypothetical protein
VDPLGLDSPFANRPLFRDSRVHWRRASLLSKRIEEFSMNDRVGRLFTAALNHPRVDERICDAFARLPGRAEVESPRTKRQQRIASHYVRISSACSAELDTHS